jgi:hypothetical protein
MLAQFLDSSSLIKEDGQSLILIKERRGPLEVRNMESMMSLSF